MIERALKLTREFHRLSQTELARRLEISKSYVSELESGTKTPTIELLKKYSDEFDISMSTLMTIAERFAAGTGPKQTAKAHRVLQFLEWVLDDEQKARGSHGTRARKTA